MDLGLDFFTSLLSPPVDFFFKRVLNSNRVFEFDPLEHRVQGETGTHDIYFCPVCEDKRGKADKQGKFYFDRSNMVGYCFLCESTGILKTDRGITDVEMGIALSSLMQRLANNSTLMSSILKSIPKIQYNKMFDQMSPKCRDYLDKRNPIINELKFLELRELPEVGVVAPIRVNGDVVSYQLRYFNPKNPKKKYHLPSIDKLLYSPNDIFQPGNTVDEITIVEGIFDAIAALILGYPNPVAIFGKTITPLQLYLMRTVVPNKIKVYMDKTDLSFKVRRSLFNQLPAVTDISIVFSDYGKDPEETLMYKLAKGDDLFLRKIVNNVEHLNEQVQTSTSIETKSQRA